MLNLPDFETDYPTDGKFYYTNKGMSLYQCWVLKELIEIGAIYPKKVIPNLIKTGFIRLSKSDFEERPTTAIVLSA
jgi:hypothetical protein